MHIMFMILCGPCLCVFMRVCDVCVCVRVYMSDAEYPSIRLGSKRESVDDGQCQRLTTAQDALPSFVHATNAWKISLPLSMYIRAHISIICLCSLFLEWDSELTKVIKLHSKDEQLRTTGQLRLKRKPKPQAKARAQTKAKPPSKGRPKCNLPSH